MSTQLFRRYIDIINEATHLDPVGHEDSDIDNDGDHDRSDRYLKHRRDVISKNIKEAHNKITKAQAEYVNHSEGNQRCGNCNMYRDPNTCTLVEGYIYPEGWCKFWRARQLEEKWGTETKVSPEERGKYAGKTKAELLKSYNALKKSGPHPRGSKEYGRMRELAFAIRAKSGWGKVK